MKTNSIGPFVGINNRLPDHKLSRSRDGDSAGDFLRNAVNVDLTSSGTLARREGYTLDVAGGNARSLWSGDGDSAFYADGATLYRYPRTAIKTGISPDLPVSFTMSPLGHVYWSNGVVLERIVGGASAPASVPLLNPEPSVSVATGGSLPKGVYQFSFTRIEPNGEESGGTWPAQVEVPDNGVVTIAGLSGRVGVYMTSTNGDMLYRVTTTQLSSLAIPVLPDMNGRALTTGLRPMPPGQIVQWFKQRLLVASDSMLYFSDPMSPGWHSPSKGYIPFPSRITIVSPMEGGVYVVADKTYWLAGPDIEGCEVVERLPYGAAEGSATHDPRNKRTWWYSDRGLVMANDEGVVNVQEQNIAPVRVEQGASIFREQDGLRQIIATTMRQDTSVAQASSYMEMEVIRKGEMQ